MIGAADIIHLGHPQIDKAKWDASIASSSCPLIYANSRYLDAMSPGWDALMVGDYQVIMPLTWRSKLGIQYLCQPAFSQQLGVFSKTHVSKETADAFMKKVSMEYKFVEIFLNYGNESSNYQSQHVNLVLSLQQDYETIAKGFRNKLPNSLKRSEKFHLQYSSSDNVAEAVSIYQKSYQNRMGARSEDYDSFTKLATQLMQSGEGFIRKVNLSSGELLAIGFFAKDKHRIYNLTSTTLPNGRTLEANHFLFDQLIREFSGSGLLLDCEGSDLQGIARFYQKFGAVNQPYFFWKSNRLPAILRWWKR